MPSLQISTRHCDETQLSSRMLSTISDEIWETKECGQNTPSNSRMVASRQKSSHSYPYVHA